MIKAIEVELSPQVEEKTKLSEKKAANDCKINQLKDEIEKKKEEIEQKKKKLDDELELLQNELEVWSLDFYYSNPIFLRQNILL